MYPEPMGSNAGLRGVGSDRAGVSDALITVAYIPMNEERSDGCAVVGGNRRRYRGWALDGFDDVPLWFVRLRAASLRGVGELLGRVRSIGAVVWRNHRARP
jgi:hypothetical protein